MKNALFAIIGFVLGAATGGAVSYYILEKRYQEEFDEEIEEYKAQVAAENEAKEETTVKDDHKDVEDCTPTNVPADVVEKVKEMQEGIKRTSNRNIARDDPANNKTNYSALSNKTCITSKGGLANMTDQSSPYEISEDDYYDNPDDYDQVELCYSREGDLRNLDGQVIEDADDLVGLRNLEALDAGEVDEVFVRNDRYKEVYWIDCSEPPIK